jgi:hypothetical protein
MVPQWQRAWQKNVHLSHPAPFLMFFHPTRIQSKFSKFFQNRLTNFLLLLLANINGIKSIKFGFKTKSA